MKIKNNKGITGVDVTIAVVVLAIFVTLITNMFYNVSQIGNAVKRKSEATYIATQVIEALKRTSYEKIPAGETAENSSITLEKLNTLLEEAGDIKIEPANGYSVDIVIENYKKIKNDTTLQDILKRVTVTVKYKEKTKEKTVYLSTVIVNEENAL